MKLWSSSVAMFAVLAFAGCATAPPGPEKGHGAPALDQLANASYPGIREEPVRLVDGTYEGPAYAPGGASRPTVTLVRDHVTFADLDADGVDEALVLLVEQTGGSGSFVYLAVVATRNGNAAGLDAVRLGDRVRVRSMTVLQGGTVRVRMLEHRPGDPACCPTLKTSSEWALRDGVLLPTGRAREK